MPFNRPDRLQSPYSYAPGARGGLPYVQIDTYEVLRRTYLLLGATLIFSALCAFAGMSAGMRPVNPFLALIVELGLLFWIQAARNSGWGVFAVFAFTGFTGLTLAPLLNFYLRAIPGGGDIIALALGGTGAIFGALSAYALISKRDFSNLRAFLFAGLIVIVLAGVANLFLHMAALQVAISAAAMVIFSGLILFDTSRIVNGGETNYISATISLYLDILNLFIALLQLLGMSSSRDR